jgi:hypothetical protein
VCVLIILLPFSHPGSRQWISLLDLPVHNAWRTWVTDDQQAGGFVQDYLGGQLTFITVRGAGYERVEASYLFDCLIVCILSVCSFVFCSLMV